MDKFSHESLIFDWIQDDDDCWYVEIAGFCLHVGQNSEDLFEWNVLTHFTQYDEIVKHRTEKTLLEAQQAAETWLLRTYLDLRRAFKERGVKLP